MATRVVHAQVIGSWEIRTRPRCTTCCRKNVTVRSKRYLELGTPWSFHLTRSLKRAAKDMTTAHIA